MHPLNNRTIEANILNSTKIEIFHAGRQEIKVRALSWFFLLVGLGCLWWGYDLSQSYGLSPGDGGVLRPLAERLAWGGFVALFGLALIISMDLYGRLYICRVQLDPATSQVFFKTVHWWGFRQITTTASQIIGSSYHPGDFEGGDFTVNAPFYFVRLRGHSLPLILDGQGKFVQAKLAKKLLNL